MTEDEAKKRWCPFARSQTADTDNAPAVNRTLQGATDLGCYCIGSACMAWRWHKREGATLYSRKEGTDEKLGFCGLAGKP